MKADLWMPFYIGDYLRDTLHLTRADHGSYLLLIMAYWANGGPLPDDPEALCAIAKVEQTEWPSVSKRLAKFFQVQNGLWVHKRIDRELIRSKALSVARSMAGKAGVEAKRKQSLQQSSSNGSVLLKQRLRQHNTTHIECVGEGSKLESPVELPVGFPKTIAEATARAASVGCPEDFIQKTWNKAISRGGCDSRNIPIRNWPAQVAAEWGYERERIAKQNATRQPSHRPGVDRSAGTANEGRANDYAGLG